MTYADRDWSDGRGYKHLGFEVLEQSFPNEILVDNEHLTRKFYKKKEQFDKEKFAKIPNSGSIKLLKKL